MPILAAYALDLSLSQYTIRRDEMPILPGRKPASVLVVDLVFALREKSRTAARQGANDAMAGLWLASR